MGHKPLVWIVDDELAPRESLAAFVSTLGYRVEACTSGEEFLEKFDESDGWGIVFCDMCMKGISGLELQERLGSECLFSFVMVSGFADVPLAVTTMQRGAITLLEKPYTQQALSVAVATGMERSKEKFETYQRREGARCRLSVLSPDQLAFLTPLLKARRNKELADEWDVSERTIERRRKTIFQLLNICTSVEIAQLLHDAQVELPILSRLGSD